MSDVSDEILQLEESMGLDEPEGAVALPVVSTPQETPEIPESRGVTLARESSPLSDTEPWVRVRTARSRRDRSRRRRSQSRGGERNTRRNYGRSEFHGPWRYGPYEWRCEVEACRRMESLPSFSSLEKHFQKLHHEKRVEYVCAFRGPTCFRAAKHDVARDHCRSARRHRNISKAERLARTERMPWILAYNPDYIQPGNIPPLPKDPVGGQALDPTPRPLAFAAPASPVTSQAAPTASPAVPERRCSMVRHDGAYPAVRPVQQPVTPEAQSMPAPTSGMVSFGARDIRRGVITSRSTPQSVRPTPTLESVPQPVERSDAPQPPPGVVEMYRREELEIRTELTQVRREIEVLQARESLLRRRQQALREEQQTVLSRWRPREEPE